MIRLKKRDIKKALKAGAKAGGVSLADVRRKRCQPHRENVYLLQVCRCQCVHGDHSKRRHTINENIFIVFLDLFQAIL